MTQLDLGVGNEAIDSQHQAMLACMAQLGRCVDGRDPAGSATALDALWEATVANFAFEEDLMAEHAYPEREAHRAAHHLFLQDLQALMRDLREKGLEERIAAWALQRLPDWLTFHIQTNDAPLALFAVRRLAARVVAEAHGQRSERPKRSDA